MDWKQGTIEDIVNSELTMVLTAHSRYGEHYAHAREASLFLSGAVKSIIPTRTFFGRFYSQVKKQHTLALLSTVRLHRLQSMMDLRQVIENGACAAFAIANPEHRHFLAEDERGLLKFSKKLRGLVYKWLDDNYPHGSEPLKKLKTIINDVFAHSNPVSTGSNFEILCNDKWILSPFFDFEDDRAVKTDLWLIGNIAIGLLDLFYGVNKGQDCITFVDNFPRQLHTLEAHNQAIRTTMTSTGR